MQVRTIIVVVIITLVLALSLYIYAFISAVDMLSGVYQYFFGSDEKLTFQLDPYRGNGLRLDGYYYTGNEHVISIYFLYRNGVILHTYSFSPEKWKEKEEKFRQNDFLQDLKNSKRLWGIFKIENNLIAFERLYPSDGPDPAYIRTGYILNDTTFIVTKSKHSHSDEEYEENEIYHFKQFSPKPDSVSKFIE